MALPSGDVTHISLNRQEQTCLQWSEVVVEQHGNTFDISDHSDSSDNSDSRHEQKCLQDIATACISNRHYLGFGVLLFVFELIKILRLIRYFGIFFQVTELLQNSRNI